MNDSYAVDVQGVEKRFGGLKALDGVTLRVRKGEIYGLLGPNGAGKTTLIRTIVGLLAPDAGTVTVLGRKLPNLDVLRDVGYMTQQAALYPGLSVEENLQFFAAIYGVEDGVQEALELVDLDKRKDSVVATISGGMRQRCSLAVALVHRPHLLLLDEPTVGVDPQLRVQFWEYFRRMADSGTTITVSLQHSTLVSASPILVSDGDSRLKNGSLVAYVVFPSDFSQSAQSGVIAPEVHVEGTQPSAVAPVLAALQQGLASAASRAPGAIRFAPKVTYLYAGARLDSLDYFGAAAIGLLDLFRVLVITVVSFLNERSQGTLERLMASPLRRGEIVVGYVVVFTVLAVIPAGAVLLFALCVVNVHVEGNV